MYNLVKRRVLSHWARNNLISYSFLIMMFVYICKLNIINLIIFLNKF